MSSCSFPEFKKEKVSTYAIWYSGNSQDSPCKTDLNAVLRSCGSNQMLNSTFMFTKTTEHSISYLPYCRWRVPPAAMIDELLYTDLNNSKIFLYVGKTPNQNTNIIISPYLYMLWSQLSEPRKVRVGLRFEVVKISDTTSEVVLMKSYEKDKQIDDTSAETYAKVVSDIVRDISKNFIEDLCNESKLQK
jgi:ABC-type uncharacterized transport system auxiliary subunit